VKPSRFEYLCPRTVDEALSELEEAPGETRPLAGGQSLMPLISMRLSRPERLLDLNRLRELDFIARDNGELVIGALARQAAVGDSQEAAVACPLLALAVPHIGHPAIRNRGSVVGSVAHADPAAELPAVLTALGATATARGAGGERRIPVEQLYRGAFTTVLEPNELLIEVGIPVQRPDSGSAFLELARRHGDFAVVGVAAALALDGQGRLEDVRLVVFATGPMPRRLRGVEQLLEGQAPSDGLYAEAANATREQIDAMDDIHASAKYRRRVAGVLMERALAEAVRQTSTGAER
jgi:carbon-monoxide dehydrogenase medium subunit